METGSKFEQLVEIVTRLRKECPWDREQTFASLKPYLVEEVYEAHQAIDDKDYHKLAEELGDMLLHIVMLSVFAKQSKKFNIDDVIATISAKMVRRHPHVFAKTRARNKEAVWRKWEIIKQQEKKAIAKEAQGMLESVPKSLPALYRADKVQRRAARVGFDWDQVAGAWEKVYEELDEVHELLKPVSSKRKAVSGKQGKVNRRVKEEIGDLLFAITNVARKLNIDAEEALQEANGKFIRRFSTIEKKLKVKKLNIQQMDLLWDQAKAREK